MARLIAPYKITYPPSTQGNIALEMDYERAELDKLVAFSNDLDTKEIVGFVLGFPVADGTALYRVIKKKPLTIQHLPFFDRWQIPIAYVRGLSLRDVMDQKNRTIEMLRIFGKPKPRKPFVELPQAMLDHCELCNKEEHQNGTGELRSTEVNLAICIRCYDSIPL